MHLVQSILFAAALVFCAGTFFAGKRLLNCLRNTLKILRRLRKPDVTLWRGAAGKPALIWFLSGSIVGSALWAYVAYQTGHVAIVVALCAYYALVTA